MLGRTPLPLAPPLQPLSSEPGREPSVAEPAPLNGDFRQANDEAGKKLRQVKNRRLGVTAEPHMPYIAFCASCGMTLADIHGQLKGGKGEHRRNYYCEVCQTKAAERDRKPRAILDDFYAAYCTAIGDEQTSEANWPEDADDIARYDLRQQNYVAYLVADGNGMGQLFGRCDQTQIEKVSVGLTSGLHASLAKPAAAFGTPVPGQTNMVPLLPLILGGDNLSR